MSIMSSDVIDLEEKDGVFTVNIDANSKRDLTISKVSVKRRGTFDYLSKNEINAILASIADARDRLYLLFLWKTGCRVTESINVEKRHLNASSNRITIRWLKSRRWNEREINVPVDLMQNLLIFARSMAFDEKLFAFSRQRAEQITKKYFGVSPHVFRHSFAVNWVEQDLPIDILQTHLGHARITSTLVYVHATNKRTRDAIDKIDWGVM